MSFRKYNNGTNNKSKRMKKESINTILGNTNYQPKKSQTKFNSIGKLVSTNLQVYSLEKSNKPNSIKHKFFNNINNNNKEFKDNQDHLRGASNDFQKNVNLKLYNNSKSEYKINSENLKDIFYNSRTGKKKII